VIALCTLITCIAILFSKACRAPEQHGPPKTHTRSSGFTLIEMSIVLVVIGLVVGGILTGQSLIAAAGVRAQIAQIENFNTAANTFFEKYGYLPGDIPAGPAAQFGFASRGTLNSFSTSFEASFS
jgi:prepilin-type N-terminal cleavage/methylation domain-containing protein